MNSYIVSLDSINHVKSAGSKAYNLKLLRKWGLRVPMTFVCKQKAFEDYKTNKKHVLDRVSSELSPLIDISLRYAVRSSANLEDSSQYSFAGQFVTYLDVRSLEEIIEAVAKLWDIKEDAGLQVYLHRMGSSCQSLRMGVIIQEMVSSKLSGVVFTRNPLTGFDETIVEMVEGQGISLMQRGMTPVRWVYKWGEWLEEPPEHKKYTSLIKNVVKGALIITKRYRQPVDLEWSYDGSELFWLQLREITSISGVGIYSNRISKEILPGMIKPLVWSVNIPIVNSSWKKILSELVGKAAELINIHRLSKAIYYRTYFNMAIFGDIFELLGMPR
jgi:pyruvate,water dikinase